MDAMSFYLGELEGIQNPPEWIIRKTRMSMVLRKITQLEDIPREHELHIKERATALHAILYAIINPQLPVSHSQACQIPSKVGCREQATSSPTTHLSSPALRSLTVIDLTDSSDLEQLSQPTGNHSLALRKVGEKQTPVTLSTAAFDPHSQNYYTAVATSDLPSSITNNDPSSGMNTASNARKRKRRRSAKNLPAMEPSIVRSSSSGIDGSPDSTPAAVPSSVKPKPVLRPRKQRTTFQGHMHTECVWMGSSRKNIEGLCKLNAKSIDLGNKRKALSVEKRKLEKAIQSLGKRMRELDDRLSAIDEEREAALIDFKEVIDKWIDEDRNVTTEWERKH